MRDSWIVSLIVCCSIFGHNASQVFVANEDPNKTFPSKAVLQGKIVFQKVGEKDSSYSDKAPLCYIARSDAELKKISHLIETGDLVCDFNSEVLVFAFAGWKPDLEWEVDISEVYLFKTESGDVNYHLVVEMAVNGPHPYQKVRTQPCSPVVIVKISRNKAEWWEEVRVLILKRQANYELYYSPPLNLTNNYQPQEARFKVVSGRTICSRCELNIGDLSHTGEVTNGRPFAYCPYCGSKLTVSKTEG